jgi:nucleoside-diphosphate-sugar epimerase
VKALITGASGFLGKHLARALIARGYETRALVRPTSDCRELRELDVELVTGDVTRPEGLRAAVAGVDFVFHLAGLIKAFSLAEFLGVNEEGTRNVAEACAASTTPPVLLAVSSLAAAGPAPNGRARNELDPAEPVSNYGRSKRAGELAAAALAGRVPLSIVRPPVVFGPCDPSMATLFKVIARRGIHAVPGREPRRLSMIHSSDLVSALIAVAENGTRVAPPGQDPEASARGYYFVTDDEVPTFDELGLMIGRAVGRERVRVMHSPTIFNYSVAGASEIYARLRRRPGIFNLDKMREMLAGSWTCTADRIRTELGFAVAAPLEQRLRETGDWYRSKGWL